MTNDDSNTLDSSVKKDEKPEQEDELISELEDEHLTELMAEYYKSII